LKNSHQNFRRLIYLLLMTSFTFAGTSFAASAWPADNGVEIGLMGHPNGLPDGFEPSGSIWHPLRNTLLLVDDSGIIAELDPALGVIAMWEINEDLEGITFADPNTGLVYLAIEDPDGVMEFDLNTGAPTGNYWNLTSWLTGPDNHGLEAITWVDGLFYTGLQEDGNIFIFDLLSGGSVQYIATIAPHGGRDDISGLHWDVCTGTLYAIHDSHDVIVEMATDGTFIREYELVGDNQEGVAIIGEGLSGQTTIFIAQDSGEVWMYGQYAIEPCDLLAAADNVPDSQFINLECYPNPFNPSTKISFELGQAGIVSLRVYDVAGRCMRTLLKEEWDAGQHSVVWQGENDEGQIVSSGVYFALLEVDGNMKTIKLVMTK